MHSVDQGLTEQRLQEQREYWKRTLAGAPRLVELPTDRDRPPLLGRDTDLCAASIEFVFDAVLTRGLGALAQRNGVTLQLVLLAAWGALLGRLTGQTDVVIGMFADARDFGAAPRKPLALRLNGAGSPGVQQWLTLVNAQALTARQNRELSVAEVAELARGSGPVDHRPLFQLMFEWEEQPASLQRSGAVGDACEFELKLNAHEKDGCIAATIQYATASFDRDSIERHVEYLRCMAMAMAAHSALAIDRLQILPQVERHKLLFEWNETAVEYPSHCGVHELFEARVQRHPNAPAVRQGDKFLNYGELNARANQLAHELISMEVKPGDCVAVLLDRCLELVIAEVAILKCGATYVPLDPRTPASRLAYMARDSGCRALVSDGAYRAPWVEGLAQLDVHDSRLDTSPSHNLGLRMAADAAAYVMYTSGSSGRPKGVLTPHRAISRLVLNNGYADFRDTDRFAFAANPAFDASTLEVWGALLNGAEVVVIEQDTVLDPGRLARTLIETRVSTLWLTVGLFNQYADALAKVFPRLRYLIVGGDVLDAQVIAKVLRNGRPEHLLNGYGPTECTTFATTFEIKSIPDEVASIPIGRPISNTRAYILDRHGEPVPVGVVGELCLGGPGLALRYLNDPELNAQRFVDDPFVDEPGARLYKTGDRARYRADANIEFLGRADSQVKIRGFRVELGEIEASLRSCDGVRQGVVIAREDTPGDRRLVAYFTAITVARDSADTDSSAMPRADLLRAQLAAHLPEYMVPAAFVELRELPLTANGKIDRNALPAPGLPDSTTQGHEAPTGATEVALATIWCDVLSAARVGRRDNFFELGGHSLLAVRVALRVQAEMRVALSVRDIFDQASLTDLARRIDEHVEHKVDAPPIAAFAPPGQTSPLTSMQRGIWFVERSGRGASQYNIVHATRLKGALDVPLLQAALDELLIRHEGLRSQFEEADEEPRQVVLPAARLTLNQCDLAQAEGLSPELTLLRHLGEFADTPFDLSRGPLLRATLFRLGDHEQVFSLAFHHIVLDGWSLAIVLRELAAIYGALCRHEVALLPIAKCSWRDVAHWERRRNEARVHEGGLEFWVRKLAGVVPLRLPRDPSARLGNDNAAPIARARIATGTVSRIARLARAHDATTFVVLLSAVKLLLMRRYGAESVAVGVPVVDRASQELQSVVGPLLNTVVLHTDVGGGPTFETLLGRVRETALEAWSHQEVPFDAVVARAKPQREPGATPYFDVLVNSFGEMTDAPPFEGLESEHVAVHFGQAIFPLTLYIQSREGRVELSMVARRECFSDGALHALLEQYVHLLNQVAEHPARSIHAYSLRTEAHKNLLPDPGAMLSAPQFISVTKHIAAVANRLPARIAVRCGGREYQFAELQGKAALLAARLRQSGVEGGDVVAIVGRKSFGVVVAMLSVLHVGGVFLTLDAKLPPARRLANMRAARVRLMCHVGAETALAADGIEVVRLDEHLDSLPRQRVAELNDSTKVDPDGPAYVFFTSGSSGVPKAVLGRHRGLSQFVEWQTERFGVGERDRVAQLVSLSFDPVLRDVFLPLTSGACLCIPSGTDELDPLAWVAREGVSVVHTTPTLLQAWLTMPSESITLPSLRWLFVAGEPLTDVLVRAWRRRFGDAAQIVNLYGPTETTLARCYHVVPDEPDRGVQPIGVALPQTQVLIVSKDSVLCGIGEPGEIVVRTPLRSLGYLRAPEESARRFRPNPWRDDPQDLLYWTGDSGRYRDDGSLEILGRLDDQIKIRGVRIEPAEVMAALAAHSSVGQCFVLPTKAKDGELALVAYVEARAEGSADPQVLRRHLSAVLPAAFIPARIVVLHALPTLPNGKIDRAALPALDASTDAQPEYEAPVGEIEAALASIWSEVLGLARIGRRDNFFAVGGHSLLALRVASRVHKRLGIELELGEFFDKPELMTLAAAVQSMAHSEPPAIESAPRQQPMALSFAQQRLWFLSQLEGVSRAYHISISWRLLGVLDRNALQRALDRIVERHEALRTTFRAEDGEPSQHIAQLDIGLPLQHHDLRNQAGAAQELDRLGQQEADAAFDLRTGPLIRGRLTRTAEFEHVLWLTMHHIVSDGWSRGVLSGELSVLYAAYRAGQGDPLPALQIQYSDIAAWQRRWLSGEVLERQGEYWQRTLQGAPELIELPTDRPRPQRQDYAGGAVEFEFDESLTEQLKALSQRQGMTLFMTLLAAWGAVLLRLSGQDEVVIGAPVANRRRTELEPLIGFFVNTLALRLDSTGSPSVTQWLARVRTQALGAQQHQDLPFEQVVELMHPVRSLAHSPLFQVMFAWEGQQAPAPALAGLHVENLSLAQNVAKFDLTLTLREQSGRIAGDLGYATALFDKATIERQVDYLRCIASAMVADQAQPLDKLQILPEAERHKLLVQWNDTKVHDVDPRCVHELFEEQAARRPDAVALRQGERALSYGELNAQANQLAHYLRELGVRPDDRVTILLERRVELVVAVLATLKAGGAYVPLDPLYPAQRLNYMLRDSSPRVILTQGSVWANLQQRSAPQAMSVSEVPVLEMDDPKAPWADSPIRNPLPGVAGLTSQNLAYVIYTSGSTGQPKGTMVEHRHLSNLVDWHRRAFAMSAASCSSGLAGVAFDASTWELWSALCVGARLLMPPRESQDDPMELLNWWRQQPLDISFLPTPLAELAFSEGIVNPTLKTLLIGGDALRGPLATARTYDLVNNYGPTECAVVATSGRIGFAGEAIHIGRPISNGRAYILDRAGQPVPIGVRGELFIGGAGVARGYLGRPELTEERFAPDPYSPEPGARMYKTGDLARHLPDGNIEFLGRSDSQVKIRGFRIELGEIEAKLAASEGVREAVVLAREDSLGTKRLVAYYTSAGANERDSQQQSPRGETLRQQLAAQLPEYMVPAAFVALNALPLTPNGKIDRAALPDPAHEAFANARFEAPVGPIESALAQIWCEVLALESVGRNDNFFELGGHSLNATQVVSRVRRDLGVAPSVRAIFESPTLRGLAARLRLDLNNGAGRLGAESTPRRLDERDGPLPTSFPQRRMWLVQRLNPATTAYNISPALEFAGPLSAEAMVQALRVVAQRHEVFRTRFEDVGGEPMQHIMPQLALNIERIDLRDRARAERDALVRQIVGDLAAQPFDLSLPGPHRIALLCLDVQRHVLVWIVHHSIADQWSMGILFRELGQAYNALAKGRAATLSTPEIDYADYAAWQRERAGTAEAVQQLEYWRTRLDGLTPLRLPVDFARLQAHQGEGGVVRAPLASTLIAKLKQFSHGKGVTPYMTLLACFQILMARISGQTDIASAAPIANRLGVFSEGLVGTLVNTLVMRSDLSGEPTFGDFLAQVQETALQAYANQDVPFEQLVERIEIKRDVLRAPLVQVMFNLVNAPFSVQHFDSLRVESFEFERRSAQFEIAVGVDLDVFPQIRLGYASTLFAKATAQRLLESYMSLVHSVIENSNRRVDEYDVLTDAQRAELTSWNRTEAPKPAFRSVGEMISACAAWAADRPALRDLRGTLSHAQLEAQSNRLARELRRRGVRRGALVGLCVERSSSKVIAQLAILKSGAAYVPLDPVYPPDRLAMMADDAQLALLVTQSTNAGAVQWPRDKSLWLDADAAGIAAQSDAALSPDAELDAGPLDPAYVIYTSGSTGKPKGVPVPHGTVLNFLASMAREPGLTANDRVLAVTTLSFDIAVLELLLPLTVGAMIILATTEQAQDGRALRALLDEQNATLMQATPSTWRMLIEAGWTGAADFKALIGGEGLPLDLAEQLLARVSELWNMYGPTETTVWSTCWRVVRPAAGISIGRPIANTQVHVLDGSGRQCMIGVPGEIYIGGDGVAIGYLNRPDLTAERFVADPFRRVPGARMYRTGDLGRWRHDGQLEHMGRLDHQVKIRGHRIELGEIEANLGSFAGVARVVVIAREDRPGDTRIVAYIVPRGAMPAAAELRDHVRAMLPQYMVPQHFVHIESVPLLPNGKLDRSKLPKPGEAVEDANAAAPGSLESDLERGIAEIWQRLLNLEGVGRADNFFDLGGHSLLAMRAVSEIEKTLGVNISPRRLIFESLAQLAAAPSGAAPTTKAAESEAAAAPKGLLGGLKRLFGAKAP